MKRQIMLGLFFVATLTLLVGYTLFFTDTVSLFKDPVLMQVYFPEAYGLREGDAVNVAGMRIGRVRELQFDPDRAEDQVILATLSLDRELGLREGTVVMIEETTMLGGHNVGIDPGPRDGALLDMARPIYGSIRMNPIQSLSSLGDLVEANSEAVTNFLANLDVVMRDVRDGKGVIGRLMVDEEMAADLAKTISNLESSTTKIDNGEGLLGALISDPELVTSVKNAIDSIETIAADLEAGKGLAGRLVYDEELADEVEKAIDAFSSVGQKIDRGEGALGRLVSDEELARDLEEIVKNFKQASADITALTETVRSGEGSLGKILTDQELYDELLTGVKLLTRTLEDYREAAPVTAFTSVLFSAF